VSIQRLAILADVHIGLLGPQGDGAVFGDPTPLLERAVGRLLGVNPDKVVLLGDIVNRGYPHEYDRARQVLAPLMDRVEPMVGNHELQRAGIADFERAWNVSAVRETDLCGLPALLLNSGVENLPDSQWHGRLDTPQLDRLRRFLAGQSGRPVLILCHHPIKGTVTVSDEPMFALENSQEVQRIVSAHRGPVVLISGHTHTASVARRGLVTHVGCPALGFWPHAFLVLDIGNNTIELSTVHVCADPTESPDAGASNADYRAGREGCAADRAATIVLR
jgi:3',5'-cyclic AMP phosphodiesterase CpdA